MASPFNQRKELPLSSSRCLQLLFMRYSDSQDGLGFKIYPGYLEIESFYLICLHNNQMCIKSIKQLYSRFCFRGPSVGALLLKI